MGISKEELKIIEDGPPLVQKGYISAPQKFWDLTPEQVDKYCNGCGPKPFGWAIPDRIWGLKITDT